MTDPNYTAIAVVVDRSGSMQKIKSDAEGALRSFVEDQRTQPGRCTVRLDEFDTQHNLVYGSTDINVVPDYTLVPRGGTALLDAMGRAINGFGHELASLPEERRPGRVVFIVITDGEENSSIEFTRDQVFKLVNEQKDKYNWDFVFLAANQDAIQTGASFGIGQGSSLTFATTNAGVYNTSQALSNYVTTYRSAGASSFTDADRQAATED
jgi:Mg-chelatase subunit ChlD